MSLRDQLLKSGLVSEQKAKKVEAESRKKAHQGKKNKALGAAEAARRAEEKRKREAEAERKREHDRQLNRIREAERKQRENDARVFQLIESHRLNEAGADIPYHFIVDDRYIRYVRVTPKQQTLLAMGRIGIVANDMDEYDYPLIGRETVDKIADIFPQRILLLYPESTLDDLRKEEKE